MMVNSSGRAFQEISGWLPLDKPKDITSAQAVAKAKRLFSVRKAGHAGTLDKPASGLLAIAFGEATKTVPFVIDSKKIYEFRAKFGESTSTDDATGEVMDSSIVRPTDAQINNALMEFRGDILQTPPVYSAVKVSGKRAAAHAASGKSVELKARPLTVYRLNLVSRLDDDTADFVLECGKGGYVRAIARDLGKKLGCLAHVLELRRIAAGPFSLNDCMDFSEFNDTDRDMLLAQSLKPLETGLHSLREVRVNEASAAEIRHGRSIAVTGLSGGAAETVWTSCNNQAVATGELFAGKFRPKRVFRVQA